MSGTVEEILADRKPSFRTDRHRNPTAFTTDIAHEAGLVLGVDYEKGEPFGTGAAQGEFATLWTARLLGDPIETTIRVIDKLGFKTSSGRQRWTYINLPSEVWQQFIPLNSEIPGNSINVMTGKPPITKQDVIGLMYHNEGGTEMLSLFPRIIR